MAKAVRRLRAERAAYHDMFAALILFVFFFAYLTESYVLKATSIYQMLVTLSVVILSRKRRTNPSQHRRAGEKAEATDTEPVNTGRKVFNRRSDDNEGAEVVTTRNSYLRVRS